MALKSMLSPSALITWSGQSSLFLIYSFSFFLFISFLFNTFIKLLSFLLSASTGCVILLADGESVLQLSAHRPLWPELPFHKIVTISVTFAMAFLWLISRCLWAKQHMMNMRVTCLWILKNLNRSDNHLYLEASVPPSPSSWCSCLQL